MADLVDYLLVLPPGWARIPLDERASTASSASSAIVNRAVASAPAGTQANVRRFVTARLREVVRGAQTVSGIDLYLPTELIDGAPVPLSIVMSAPQLADGDNSAADALLAFAARGGATAVEVGGRLAVRQAGDAPAVLAASGELQIPQSRRISYAIVPPTGDRLLVVTGSMLRVDTPDADDLLDAVEQLFDAMALTIRFAPTALRTAVAS